MLGNWACLMPLVQAKIETLSPFGCALPAWLDLQGPHEVTTAGIATGLRAPIKVIPRESWKS